MIAQRIVGANANPGKPANFEGRCGHPAIRIEAPGTPQMRCHSAWEPTPRELEMLNRGGHVILTVCGWQVPVALSVEMPTGDGVTPV